MKPITSDDLAPMPEVQLGPRPSDQASLELAVSGVERYVWNSAYGAILIEVREGAAYVNGERVTPLREIHGGGPRDAVAHPTRSRP